MSWKNWYLNAYYNKVYSLDKLKEKLQALESVEEDWKNHINYCEKQTNKERKKN